MGARYQLDTILEWDQRIFFFSFFLYMVGKGIFHILRSLLEWRDRKWSYHKKCFMIGVCLWEKDGPVVFGGLEDTRLYYICVEGCWRWFKLGIYAMIYLDKW